MVYNLRGKFEIQLDVYCIKWLSYVCGLYVRNVITRAFICCFTDSYVRVGVTGDGSEV